MSFCLSSPSRNPHRLGCGFLLGPSCTPLIGNLLVRRPTAWIAGTLACPKLPGLWLPSPEKFFAGYLSLLNLPQLCKDVCLLRSRLASDQHECFYHSRVVKAFLCHNSATTRLSFRQEFPEYHLRTILWPVQFFQGLFPLSSAVNQAQSHQYDSSHQLGALWSHGHIRNASQGTAFPRKAI